MNLWLVESPTNFRDFRGLHFHEFLGQTRSCAWSNPNVLAEHLAQHPMQFPSSHAALLSAKEHMPGTHQRPEGSAQRPISLFLSVLRLRRYQAMVLCPYGI